MSSTTRPDPVVPDAAAPSSRPTVKREKTPRRRRLRVLTRRDRVVVGVMVGVPTFLVLALVWLPALASVVLSFARWDGYGGVSDIEWIGTKNYYDIATIYPPFEPAIRHNLIWLGVLFFVATPLGILFAVLLDRDIRASRFYQTSFYLPVVLSLALIGFIWQLIYSRDQGLLNEVLNRETDWLGDPNINLWAVLAAASWKHAGYIMLLYLAGLKSVDPTLREAAAIDGASSATTFFRVVLPVMRPVNIVVLVITVIESLRAFDLVWVINRGRNGLELISALVLSNIIGEASRIGFGSALATIMLVVSSVFITVYLFVVMRGDD